MKVTILMNTITACEYYLENDELDDKSQICAGGTSGKVTNFFYLRKKHFIDDTFY